jgi:hypothetical protein
LLLGRKGRQKQSRGLDTIQDARGKRCVMMQWMIGGEQAARQGSNVGTGTSKHDELRIDRHFGFSCLLTHNEINK